MSNVSMKGIFIRTTESIALDTPCDIEITISGSTSKLRMELEGKVVRNDKRGLGIELVNRLEWFALFPIYVHYGKKKGKGLEKTMFSSG